MLVVLPTPLTPTTSSTPSWPSGASISFGSAGATSLRLRTSSSCRTRYRSFELCALPSSTSLRRISSSWSVVCTPTSACSKRSSSSSHSSSSIGRGCSKTLAMRAKTPWRDFSTLLSSLNQRLRITGQSPARTGPDAELAAGVRSCQGRLWGGGGDAPWAHREDVRDALGVHAHAVHGVGLVHGRSVMRDDDELYLSSELGQQIGEALHVGFVQGSVNLVQHAERRRVDLEQPEQERDDRQRPLPTAQRQ